VKRLVVLPFGLAACHADLDPPWQLDHDRVVTVRSTPPHVATGESARLDALVAHAGAATSVEQPAGMTAANAPAGLFTAVNFIFDHWEVIGPDAAQLDAARAELGLAAGAPVPLHVTFFTGDFTSTKIVWLGDDADNPPLPTVHIAAPPPDATLVVSRDRDVAVSVAAADASWFTSCGTLDDADQPDATLHVYPDDAQQGELAVVVRDGNGGIVWQVWPIVAN
jgi:hypothetical protein